MMMRQVSPQLQSLVEPVVVALGCELVGVEYLRGPRGGTLCVYIDRDGGVTVDDCARVSHQLSGALDVEDLIADEYTLEVSSPGIDRPLFKKDDFARFTGHPVRVRLYTGVAGRRNFRGVLQGMRGEDVVIDVDGSETSLPFREIEKANLMVSG